MSNNNRKYICSAIKDGLICKSELCYAKQPYTFLEGVRNISWGSNSRPCVSLSNPPKNYICKPILCNTEFEINDSGDIVKYE